jgi:ketosteroid isomerase-like protein
MRNRICMRDLIAAEKFYGLSRNRKIGLFIVISMVVAGLLTVFPGNLSNLRNTESKIEIQAVLIKFNESYRKKDVAGPMALYADAPEVVAIGAGNVEQCIGHEAIGAAYKKEFSEFGEIKSVEHKIRSLTISREIASLAADRYMTVLRKGEVIQRVGRLTAVFKKIHGRWFFIQTHFSLPPHEPDIIS